MRRSKQQPAAATMHSHIHHNIKCRGALYRTGDGADKLSEHMGRIVVQCDKCGQKLSLPFKDSSRSGENHE